MKVVNLFGGPGCGKSSMAASVFAQLKWKGVVTEIVLEHSKLLAWERPEIRPTVTDEIEAFNYQYRYLRALKNHNCTIAVTDAPLFLMGLYEPKLRNITEEAFDEFDNLNFLLRRLKPYEQKGRWHSGEEAKTLDNAIRTLLAKREYCVVDGSEKGSQLIIEVLSNLVL